MKNSLYDLHNLLFSQLEKLSDDDINGKELEGEIGRAKAMALIGSIIVKNCDTILKARNADENKGFDAPTFMSLEDRHEVD